MLANPVWWISNGGQLGQRTLSYGTLLGTGHAAVPQLATPNVPTVDPVIPFNHHHPIQL